MKRSFNHEVAHHTHREVEQFKEDLVEWNMEIRKVELGSSCVNTLAI